MPSFDTWPPLREPELIPYRALSDLPVKSIWVLAPHPDDEVFGCGGLIALAQAQGVRVQVLVLTDGAGAGDPVVREAESRAAASALGLPAQADAMHFWHLPDRGLVPDEALVARLHDHLCLLQPDWVLAPSPFEVHPDHRALCRATLNAWSKSDCSRRSQLGFYEVGQPLLPSELLDITPVWAKKQAAMGCFLSQLRLQRYDEQLAALNRYRAYTLGPAVSHAEAYWFPPSSACESPATLWQALAGLMAQRMGGAMASP